MIADTLHKIKSNFLEIGNVNDTMTAKYFYERRNGVEKKNYDVMIIGGGPAGMFAAFYAGLHELKTVLIESLPQLGGQVGALYPEKPIWDVAAAPGITGKGLVEKLQQQLDLVNVDIALNQQVQTVDRTDDSFQIKTNDHLYHGKAVVIALGNGAFAPRQLALDGAEKLSEQQLSYFVPQLDQYRDKVIAVLGGGNSAMDTALMLNQVAKKVYLVHRRDRFRGLPATEQQLRDSSVELVTPYLPKAIDVDDQQKVQLTLKKMHAEGERELEVDSVVVNYGFTADHSALEQWPLGIALNDHQLIQVNDRLETSEPGIYAIGDCVTYDGKLPLIATAFGEGPRVINEIAATFYPKKRMATHSSSMHLGEKK